MKPSRYPKRRKIHLGSFQTHPQMFVMRKAHAARLAASANLTTLDCADQLAVLPLLLKILKAAANPIEFGHPPFLSRHPLGGRNFPGVKPRPVRQGICFQLLDSPINTSKRISPLRNHGGGRGMLRRTRSESDGRSEAENSFHRKPRGILLAFFAAISFPLHSAAQGHESVNYYEQDSQPDGLAEIEIRIFHSEENRMA